MDHILCSWAIVHCKTPQILFYWLLIEFYLLVPYPDQYITWMTLQETSKYNDKNKYFNLVLDLTVRISVEREKQIWKADKNTWIPFKKSVWLLLFMNSEIYRKTYWKYSIKKLQFFSNSTKLSEDICTWWYCWKISWRCKSSHFEGFLWGIGDANLWKQQLTKSMLKINMHIIY